MMTMIYQPCFLMLSTPESVGSTPAVPYYPAPVVESFGFAQELRKNTSGAAHPQLVFSHFEPLQQDPNFVVATEEEQENLDGGDYDGVNLARRIVDDVRRRKGLRVEEKAVKVATKQRTMTKMK